MQMLLSHGLSRDLAPPQRGERGLDDTVGQAWPRLWHAFCSTGLGSCEEPSGSSAAANWEVTRGCHPPGAIAEAEGSRCRAPSPRSALERPASTWGCRTGGEGGPPLTQPLGTRLGGFRIDTGVACSREGGRGSLAAPRLVGGEQINVRCTQGRLAVADWGGGGHPNPRLSPSPHNLQQLQPAPD